MSNPLMRTEADSQTVDILHVDDDRSFRELTSEALQRERDEFAITSVDSASEALERLADEDVDCIVSDYDMPGMDGIQFLEAVRDTYSSVPFVLFTGKGSETVASDAFSAGATDYVQKSGGISVYTVLAKTIENAVEKRQARRKHKRHLKAIENAEDGIAILNENSEFIFANDRYVEMHGYDRSELIGEPWDTVHPETDRLALRETVLPAAREQGHWHGQTTGLRADGGTFPRETSITTTETGELICVTQNLSERHRREQELTRYQNIVDAIADPVYTLDNEGRFIFVNEAMVEKLGYTRDELLGAHASKAVTEESLERANELIADLIQNKDKKKATVELEKTPADGSTFIGENHIALLETPDGDIEGTAGVVRDITERKQYEKELARQRSVLEAQNERLEEFASLVSHDLRNPLHLAQAHLELATEESNSEHHERISKALDRMDNLITDLLDLARQGGDVDETESVELDNILRTCWRSIQADGASLVDDTDKPVQADPTLLRQLLKNLLQNAIEHAGDEPTITVGTLPDGFFIEDDGQGIPTSERDQVFDAGYSGNDGAGLGLHIVKQVVEAHTWEIDVTEGSAGGARFEVTSVEFSAE